MNRRFSALISAAAICSLVVAGCAGRLNTPQPADTQADEMEVITADVEYASDAESLIQAATLVIVGAPVGQTEEVVTTHDGTFADYFQTVRVDEVLKGDSTARQVQVVRHGVASQAQSKRVMRNDDLRGPLSHTKQVLFLQPSARPGVFQIVGHSSGEVALDAADRTLTRGAEDGHTLFKGHTLDSIRKQVKRGRP